jgi:hypothetical protein
MMMKLEVVTPRAARWIPMQETLSVNAYVGKFQTHHFSSTDRSISPSSFFLFDSTSKIRCYDLRKAIC